MKGKKWIAPFLLAGIVAFGSVGCATTTNETGMRNNRYMDRGNVNQDNMDTNPTRVGNPDQPPQSPLGPDAPKAPGVQNGGQADPNRDRSTPIRNENKNDNYRVEKAVANRLTKIKGVRSATVIFNDANAYVGATMDPAVVRTRSQERKTKQQILDQVKRSNPNINSVYVSTAPSFVSSLREIGDDIEKGKGLENLDNRIQQLIRATFPGPNAK